MTELAEVVATSELKIYEGFDDMGLPEELLRGIYGYGFEKPSAIQSKGICPIKDGHDVLAQAQSGTGKTGTFVIGSLSRVDPTLKRVQVLVLVPVRELAQQIEGVAKALSAHMGVQVYSATGGTPLRDDIKAIERGCQFLVGTPGRIYDLMSRNIISNEYIRSLIFDEADQMLEDRFKEQVMCILQRGFPKDTKVALFSATMDTDVLEVANMILHDPVKILVNPENVPLDGIKQYYVPLDSEDWKYEVLCDLYQQLNINQALIYCNKRQRAEWLAEKMTAAGFPLSVIHGEMDVEERKRRMKDFRDGAVRVMISTDMLARGIDVQQVSLVINYELPNVKENYIHRIGRAGRFGRKGVTINLISKDETRARNEIQDHFKIMMQELPSDISKLDM
ncbi:DEAD/DEAH box helicase [bacterium]|nr:DEAD/DEAH box helicase [bacterium]